MTPEFNHIKKSLYAHLERERNAVAVLEHLLDKDDAIAIDSSMIGEKRVITLRDCNGPGTISLPKTLSKLKNTTTTKATNTTQGIIKIFIENCSNCTMQINCKLITSTIEITSCNNITVGFSSDISTIQVDLSKDINLKFLNECFGYKNCTNQNYGDRIYHAGVTNMNVQIYKSNTDDILMETNVDYIRDGATAKNNVTREECQFITFVDKQSKALNTERLIRYKGMALPESEFKAPDGEFAHVPFESVSKARCSLPGQLAHAKLNDTRKQKKTTTKKVTWNIQG